MFYGLMVLHCMALGIGVCNINNLQVGAPDNNTLAISQEAGYILAEKFRAWLLAQFITADRYHQAFVTVLLTLYMGLLTHTHNAAIAKRES